MQATVGRFERPPAPSSTPPTPPATTKPLAPASTYYNTGAATMPAGGELERDESVTLKLRRYQRCNWVFQVATSSVNQLCTAMLTIIDLRWSWITFANVLGAFLALILYQVWTDSTTIDAVKSRAWIRQRGTPVDKYPVFHSLTSHQRFRSFNTFVGWSWGVWTILALGAAGLFIGYAVKQDRYDDSGNLQTFYAFLYLWCPLLLVMVVALIAYYAMRGCIQSSRPDMHGVPKVELLKLMLDTDTKHLRSFPDHEPNSATTTTTTTTNTNQAEPLEPSELAPFYYSPTAIQYPQQQDNYYNSYYPSHAAPDDSKQQSQQQQQGGPYAYYYNNSQQQQQQQQPLPPLPEFEPQQQPEQQAGPFQQQQPQQQEPTAYSSDVQQQQQQQQPSGLEEQEQQQDPFYFGSDADWQQPQPTTNDY